MSSNLNILSAHQFGFRRRLGADDLLTALQHQWAVTAGNGDSAHVLAIDIAGALTKRLTGMYFTKHPHLALLALSIAGSPVKGNTGRYMPEQRGTVLIEEEVEDSCAKNKTHETKTLLKYELYD